LKEILVAFVFGLRFFELGLRQVNAGEGGLVAGSAELRLAS